VSPVRAIVVTRFGGPEVLKLRERPDPVVAPGQVVVDVSAIPLLWLDTALRSGKVATGFRSSRRMCPAAASRGG
jgi:NADPH:quinone reductase